MILNGSVLGPDGRPQTGLQLNYSTWPATLERTVVTNGSGSWEVNDSVVLLGNNYTTSVTFLDAVGAFVNVSQQVNVTTPNQRVSF